MNRSYPPASIHRYNASFWDELPRQVMPKEDDGLNCIRGLMAALAVDAILAFLAVSGYLLWRLI